jgi:hypothetical protein
VRAWRPRPSRPPALADAMTENHGYQQLHDVLVVMASRLAEAGLNQAAERIGGAAAHYPLSPPSEYLGESGLALRRVLDERDVPPQVGADALRWLTTIEQGFRAVGDRVDWG